MILEKVARRPRLINVERQMGKIALGVGVAAFLIAGINVLAGMVAGAIALAIAYKLTIEDEDTFFVLVYRRQWKTSRAADGEAGSWYG